MQMIGEAKVRSFLAMIQLDSKVPDGHGGPENLRISGNCGVGDIEIRFISDNLWFRHFLVFRQSSGDGWTSNICLT